MNGTVDEGSSSSNIVLLKTTKGDIKIELYDDKPITTGNFKKLVEHGIYDGTTFHRVIDGFMIQGGIPAGNQSVSAILDEIEDHNKNERGTVAMANTGNLNTGTSQFFINLVYNEHLDTGHTVFGKVIEGMDIVDAIAKVETDSTYKPLQDVKIIKAELVK